MVNVSAQCMQQTNDKLLMQPLAELFWILRYFQVMFIFNFELVLLVFVAKENVVIYLG